MNDETTTTTTINNISEHYKIVGLITSEAYQKSKFIITKLYNCYPKKFTKPEIRSMLDIDWNEYLLKMKRKLGNGHQIWALTKNVIIFINGQYFGDDDTLVSYITTKFRFNLTGNWYQFGMKELENYLRNILSNYVSQL